MVGIIEISHPEGTILPQTQNARGVIRRPERPHLATTDFYQFGLKHRIGSRWSMTASYFLIRSSNQPVYIPDDGSLELSDPSQSSGFETRTSIQLTDHLSFDGGITKVFNAFFHDTQPRIYLDSAPYFTTNAALTLSRWRGWSGSLRMRAIDNLLDRDYWEMQNYFESRLPGQVPMERIHGTPGYGQTISVGMTLGFGGK